MLFNASDYENLIDGSTNISIEPSIILTDHMGGFNVDKKNTILNYLQDNSYHGKIYLGYVINDELYKNYNLNLTFSCSKTSLCNIYSLLHDYNIHPTIRFKNFICSFNGSPHISRQLLTSILNKFGYFDSTYSSKNFKYSNDHIISHLEYLNLSESKIRQYSKFFVNGDLFNNTVYSYGHNRYQHNKNIYTLENKLTESFIHIVSETMATSYYPYVTEKFLYSIVTRGLFLAYAHPEWHMHLEKYYGFKKYNKIFDYSFDKVKNPVKRLVKLMEMISKFAHLSVDDWVDLYQMEMESIEYNYDHYFSKQYLRCLKKYE